MNAIPKFEPLEDRIVLDGEAAVTIEGPDEVFLGDTGVEFTLTFDNIDPTDTGYVPFIDLILPTNGTDGDDGVTLVSSTFLGTTLVPEEIVFDGSGQAVHPLAVDAMGDPIVVTGTPGDTLVVFALPYGSFSAGNPPVDVDIVLDLSNQEDLGTDLNLTARGGFALGNDPLDNPADDPTTFGASTSFVTTPKLFELTKVNNIAEEEAATGPSYVYQHTIIVKVADDQSLTDFVLTDTLPPEMVYLGNLSAPGADAANIVEPVVGAPASSTNNTLTIPFDVINGTTIVTFDFYIADVPAESTDPIIDPSTGDQVLITNTVTGQGNWDPLDTDDDLVIGASEIAINRFQATSLAIQKSGVLITDDGVVGPTPDDVYEFTLSVQVSDYFTYGDLVITDTLGNGFSFVAGSAELVATSEDGGESVTTPIDLTAFENTTTGTGAQVGETTNVWRISDALIDAFSTANPGATPAELLNAGLLRGDAVDGVEDLVNTTMQIVYRATILDQYSDNGNVGDVEISQGDLLTNDTTISGTVRDNDTPATVVGTEENDSSTAVQLPFGSIREKTVFAINGAAPDPDVIIAAGDAVTWRVVYDAPLGSFEDLRIVDNLPQNVFDATEVTTFITAADPSVPPPAGSAQYGPGDQFGALGGGSPTITTDAGNNGVNFNFNNLSVDPRSAVTIEILFTVVVEDAIFADDLKLTNQATAFESNTFGGEVQTTAIALFDYAEPVLGITKGVIATDSTDPDTTFVGDIGPTTVTAPGSSGFRFDDPIVSDDPNSLIDLRGTAIDANIENIDAGDLVSFAIVVENTGRAPNGAFNIVIEDTLPAGFEIPTGVVGLNLSVTDGTGQSIDFTGSLFDPGGIELTDRGLEGALSSYDPTAGDNILIITYDLVASINVTSNDVLENVATLTNYTAFEGTMAVPALDRTPVDLTDNATATVADVEISKQLESREVARGAGSEVLVGEEFVFTVRVDLQEGTYENAIVADTVRAGSAFGDFEMLSAEISNWGSVFTSSNGVALNTAGAVAGDGNSVSFDLGTLVNAGDNDASNDFFEFEVTARSVASDTDVGSGDRLANQARFAADNVNVAASNGVDLTEPVITIDKTATPETVTAGETVNYSIDVDNVAGARDAPAYDLVLTDVLDPNVTLNVGSVQVLLGTTNITGTAVTTGNTAGDTTIRIDLAELPEGQSLTITYTAEVLANVEAAIIIDNTADLTFDSLPADDAADERDYSVSDDASVTTAAPGISKTIVETSNDDTIDGDLVIGEFVTYEIVVDVPEGTLNNVVLQDVLPTTPGTLTYVDSEIIRIGFADGSGDIAGSALAVGDAGVNAGATTTFNFGNLVNDNNLNLNEGDQIVVRVTAQLTDLADNTSGDNLINTATFSTDRVSVSDTADVTVVEPSLDIDKTVLPLTADAGDIVTYTITSENSGTGPAYDIIIDDPLTDIGLQGTGTPTIQIVGGVAPTGADAPSVAFDGTTGALQATIPVLLPGQTIQITFDALVTDAAPFSSDLENTAQVTRFDSDPAGDGTDADDGRVYTGPTDDAIVTTPDVSLAKDYSSSSDALTSDADREVGIGEDITYLLTITVPEGSGDLVLTDVIPTGLEAISARVVSLGDGTNLTTDNLAAGDTDANAAITIGAGGTSVEFNFGTAVITGTDDAAATGATIVVEVVSRVQDIAANVDTTTLENRATLVITDPITGDTIQDDQIATETVTVVEPALDIDKVVVPTTADAGDVVTYTIESENTGSGPAYDIVINDPLTDAGLTPANAGLATIAIQNGAGADVTPIGPDAPVLVYPTGTDGLQATIPVLQPGQVVVITFDAEVTDAAAFASNLTNTAEVTRFDSDPADGVADDGRVYDDTLTGYTVPTDDAVVAIDEPSITKTVVGTDDANTAGTNVSIGEIITYEIQIDIPEGTSALTLTDDLPDGLTPVSATVTTYDTVAITSNLTLNADQNSSAFITVGADGGYAFDFGTLTNTGDNNTANDVIIITVRAQVTDIAAVQSGSTLQNEATLTIVDPVTGDPLLDPDTNTPLVYTDTADVTVVEPSLDIDKTVLPLTADAGDIVTYTITSENSGTGPAYDIIIDDPLTDIGLQGTGTPTIQIVGGVAPTGADAPSVAFDGTTGALQATIPVLLPGQTIEITFDALVTDAAPFSSDLENTAQVTRFDSDPAGDGTDADDGRVYDAGLDGYTVPTDDAIVTTPDVSLAKDYSSSSDALTSDADQEVGIGEDITYLLTITVPEGSGDLVLTDVIPTGLEAISARVVSLGDGTNLTTDNLAAGDTDANAAITIGAGGTSVEFNFGTAVITGTDDAAATGSTIVVEVVSRVQDIAANVDTTTLENRATLAITDPITGDTIQDDQIATETVTVVEPSLTIEKTGPIAANPGDVLAYQFVIENAGTGPAHDILIEDLMTNPDLTLSGTPTFTVTPGGAILTPTITAVGAGGFQVTIPSLAAGETLTVDFSVALAADAEDVTSFANLATIDYDTVPGDDPSDPPGREYEDEDDHTVASGPLLTKEATATDIGQTGSDQFDPDNVDLIIGEVVTYTFEISLPEIMMDDVVLQDTLPEGLEFVSARFVSAGAGLVEGGTTTDLSASSVTIVNAGQVTTFDFNSVDNPFDGANGADDIITVELVARVVSINATTPANSDTLTNTATLNVDATNPSGSFSFDEVTATETVDIVEPDLSFEKTGPVAVNLGDTVPYTITVVNDGGSPAFDVTISDAVADPNLTYTDGSVSITLNGVSQSLTVDESGAGFSVDIPAIGPDQTLIITYNAVMTSDIADAAGSFPNTANIAYDNYPGTPTDPASERPQTDTDDHIVAANGTLEKLIFSTSNPDTIDAEHDVNAPDLNIGEQVVFDLVLTLPEIPMDLVRLTDALPTGLNFVEFETILGAGITTDGPTFTQSGQLLTFDFANMINPSDGSVGADDVITVRVTAIAADIPSNQDGVQLTNNSSLTITPVTGEDPLDTLTDSVDVDIVEPDLTITKAVSDSEPTAGDTITYTVVVTNEPDATSLSYNAVVSDALPFDITSTGNVVLSDPALGTITSGLTPGDTEIGVEISRLAPGETLTITYDVFVGFAAVVLEDVVNTAVVTGSSSPDPDLPGREETESDQAVIEVEPIPTDQKTRERLTSLGIDDAKFLPILSIDPIYSGTAEPGSNVTVSLYRDTGALSYTRHILADAGGHWIAIFPRVEYEQISEDFWDFFDGSNVFSAPVQMIDDVDLTGLAFANDTRSLVVGADILEESYDLKLSTDRSSILPQDHAMHNARTFYANAINQMPFLRADTLKIDEVFENIAADNVARLYEASTNPLGDSLNRFNYEFLSDATASPGSAR